MHVYNFTPFVYDNNKINKKYRYEILGKSIHHVMEAVVLFYAR